MHSEHVSPPVPPDLRPLVNRWTGYRYEGLTAGTHLGLPSPALTVVISLGPPTSLAATPDPRQPPDDYDALVGGLHTRPAVIEYGTSMAGVQLDLTPAGARVMLGVPAGALSAAVVHLEDVVGRHAGELHERLCATSAWEERFALLAAALRHAPRVLQPVPPALDRAWRLLVGGAGKVSDVATEIGYSRRHLDQRFAAEFGLSPKRAARVARFHRSRLAVQTGDSLAAVAVAAGYYDQAHMAREWNELAGLPPSRWIVEEDLPFVQDGEPELAASWAA